MKDSSLALKLQQQSNQKKLESHPLKTLTKAFGAGISIAIVTHIYILSAYGTYPQIPFLGKFLGASLFPIGLWMILMTQSELFTGNILLTMTLYENKNAWPSILKNWFLVYTGNFLGALFTIYTLLSAHFFDQPEIQNFILHIAESKTSKSFLSLLLLGILCNVLVCMAVHLSFYAESMTGKFLALWAPVILFVLAGFEHSVANMFYLPLAGLIHPQISISKILLGNLFPVTLGNILGGVAISGYFLMKK